MTQAASAQDLSAADLERWRRDGFVIVRGLYPRDEVGALRAETDRLLVERADLISPWNLRCRYMPHHETGEPLFEVFDPVLDIAPVCERFAYDPRLLGLIESLLGEPPRLFKEKLIFKPAGARGYDLHQDIPLAWDDFPRTFLTALIAIDPMSPRNGCTEVFSGYHDDFLSHDPDVYMLPDATVDPARRVWLDLTPGDVAVFHGLTPHRSGPNRSGGMRRSLYLSYNAASDGGDRRAAHYTEFRRRMTARRPPDEQARLWFG